MQQGRRLVIETAWGILERSARGNAAASRSRAPNVQVHPSPLYEFQRDDFRSATSSTALAHLPLPRTLIPRPGEQNLSVHPVSEKLSVLGRAHGFRSMSLYYAL